MANPRLGECYTAVNEVGGRHVRLKVEYTQGGWWYEVVETDGNTVIESGFASDPGDLAKAKTQAEEAAEGYLSNQDLHVPPFQWKPA